MKKLNDLVAELMKDLKRKYDAYKQLKKENEDLKIQLKRYRDDAMMRDNSSNSSSSSPPHKKEKVEENTAAPDNI